jgi:hypothetical protein
MWLPEVMAKFLRIILMKLVKHREKKKIELTSQDYCRIVASLVHIHVKCKMLLVYLQ